MEELDDYDFILDDDLEELEEEEDDLSLFDEDEEDTYYNDLFGSSMKEVDDEGNYIPQQYSPQQYSPTTGGGNTGDLINDVIYKESRGNPNAVSPKGAMGIMQIMPDGALADYNQIKKTKYSKKDLFNPDLNKEIGTWYLQERIPQMLNSFGIPVNRQTVLASYNGGIGRVVDHYKKGKSLPKETQNYMQQLGGDILPLKNKGISYYKHDLENLQPTIDRVNTKIGLNADNVRMSDSNGALNTGANILSDVANIYNKTRGKVAQGLSMATDVASDLSSQVQEGIKYRKYLQSLNVDLNDYVPIQQRINNTQILI